MKSFQRKSATLYQLFFLSGPVVRTINLITLYRTIMFPVLMVLIFTNQFHIFRWLLIVSFLTDAVDGHLARKHKVTSILGAKLDSIGDDLTILAAVSGLFVARPEFIQEQLFLILIGLGLFILQIIFSIIRYGKISSFHTYLAKLAAILQGFFLCSMFLFSEPAYWLFYLAMFVTVLELIEEIAIVAVMKKWQTDVKSLYWVIRKQKRT
jgi:phosphatidylglycerophosphate synthase